MDKKLFQQLLHSYFPESVKIKETETSIGIIFKGESLISLTMNENDSKEDLWEKVFVRLVIKGVSKYLEEIKNKFAVAT